MGDATVVWYNRKKERGKKITQTIMNELGLELVQVHSFLRNFFSSLSLSIKPNEP
jgi:hypothetical protein